MMGFFSKLVGDKDAQAPQDTGVGAGSAEPQVPSSPPAGSPPAEPVPSPSEQPKGGSASDSPAPTDTPAPTPAPEPPTIHRIDVKLFEIDIGYQENGDALAMMYFKWLDEAGNTQVTSARLKSGDSIARLISVLEETADRITK